MDRLSPYGSRRCIRQGETSLPGIGIDIGGTGIKAGRLGETNQVVAALERPTPADADAPALLAALTDILDVLNPSSDTGGDHGALGIGFAGAVDPEPGIVRRSPHLPRMDGVSLRLLLEEAWGRDVLLWNDANAAAWGEYRLGAAQGSRTAVFLALGTGVGGAILSEGRLLMGSHGLAGEIGHMPVILGGPACACGSRGCLEAVVAAGAIVRRYRERFPPGKAPQAASPRDIAKRADSGDPEADQALRETGRILGAALTGLTHLLDPDCIVIGGGVLGSVDRILPEAVAVLRGACLWSGTDLPEVRAAALGAGAGWMGAAMAADDRLGAS